MSNGQSRRDTRGDRRPRDGESAEEAAYIESVVKIYRVAKVVKGGRNFRFSAIVVVGDGKGRVGAAKGKAREVPEAMKPQQIKIGTAPKPRVIESKAEAA